MPFYSTGRPVPVSPCLAVYFTDFKLPYAFSYFAGELIPWFFIRLWFPLFPSRLSDFSAAMRCSYETPSLCLVAFFHDDYTAYSISSSYFLRQLLIVSPLISPPLRHFLSITIRPIRIQRRRDRLLSRIVYYRVSDFVSRYPPLFIATRSRTLLTYIHSFTRQSSVRASHVIVLSSFPSALYTACLHA